MRCRSVHAELDMGNSSTAAEKETDGRSGKCDLQLRRRGDRQCGPGEHLPDRHRGMSGTVVYGTSGSAVVDPEDWFDPWRWKSTGSTRERWRAKLTIADLADELRGRLDRSIIVSHTGFDRNALERTLSRYGLEPPRSVRWLDSARGRQAHVAGPVRRTGLRAEEGCSGHGYRLPPS